jgi:hypothetical protein
MPKKVNTFVRFLPLDATTTNKVIVKNECYFNVVFLGGNYYGRGNFLQRIFGGRDEVTLFSSLRLQPDGLVIPTTEEPNIVLDKRAIRPGHITNIPMQLNMLVKIPAYMDSIGFGFKVATTKRSDNFSLALDVLNDATNKSVIETFIPTAVGKALGVGKVAKDIFDKIDSVNNRELIQLVVNDFIIPSQATSAGNNIFQEGYLVIFVMNEEEPEESDTENEKDEKILLESENGEVTELKEADTVFVDVDELEREETRRDPVTPASITNVEYDEASKVLKVNGKVARNTYLVIKINREETNNETVVKKWSEKFRGAVNTLANEFEKTKEKLTVLMPKVRELFTEASALLNEDGSFIMKDKTKILQEYRQKITEEQSKFI